MGAACYVWFSLKSSLPSSSVTCIILCVASKYGYAANSRLRPLEFELRWDLGESTVYCLAGVTWDWMFVDCVEQLAWSTHLCRCVGHTFNSRKVGGRRFSAAVMCHTSLVSRLRYSCIHAGEDMCSQDGCSFWKCQVMLRQRDYLAFRSYVLTATRLYLEVL